MPGAYPKHKVAKTSKDSNVKTPKTIQATEQHLAAGRDSSSTGARKSKAGNGDMPVEGGSTGEKNRKREEEKSAPQSTAGTSYHTRHCRVRLRLWYELT